MRKNINTEKATSMKFTFIVKPSTSGTKFTTRPDFGPNWTQAELDARVSAICGVPPDKCAAVARQYLLELLQAETPRRALNLFDLIYVKPSSGGAVATPEGFHSATDIKADFALGYLSDVIDDWRKTVTIEKTGDEGAAVPVVESVLNALTGRPDFYTAGQNIRLQGDRLAFTPTNTSQGVFTSPADSGPWTRLTTYGPVSDKQVYVLIPTGTTVAIRLKVINEGLHETVYTGTLSPETPPA